MYGTAVWSLVMILYPVTSTVSTCHWPCLCDIDSNGTIVGVNCANRNWTRIPPHFTFPMSVVHLSLAHNRLSVLRNGTFRHLSRLKSLDISDNRLKTLEYACFGGLGSLYTLDLSYNHLNLTTTVYPPGIFKILKKLGVLNIHGQSSVKFEYPDKALGDLVSLTSLSMDGISGATFGGGFLTLRQLTYLNMNGQIQWLPLDAFKNLTHSRLEVLDLSSCGIRKIDPGSFSGLKYLHNLDLSNNNDLGFQGMKNASFGLHYTNITTFNLDRIYPYHDPVLLKKDYFIYINETRMKSLILSGNRVYKIEQEVVRYLPETLTFLSLKRNYIVDALFCLYLIFLQNLKTIDVSYQLDYRTDANKPVTEPTVAQARIKDNRESTASNMDGRMVELVPGVTMDAGRSIFADTIAHTSTDFHLAAAIIPVPVRLEAVFASHLKLGRSLVLSTVQFTRNVLHHLDLSSNGLRRWHGKWWGLHELTFLDVSNNAFTEVSPNAFGDMPKLETLLLNGNQVGTSVMNDPACSIFSNLTRLRNLDFSNNRLVDIPHLLFASQRNLQNLSLESNFLTSIQFSLSSFVNLQLLDVSNNSLTELSTVNREEIDHMGEQSNLAVDLTGNPLLCLCDQLQQLKWMMVNKATFKNIDRYTCKVNNGSVVLMSRLPDLVAEMEIDCIAGEVTLVCAIGFVALCLILSIAAILHHKRWKLKYLYYIGRRHVKPYRRFHQEKPKLEYDAYLSFADSCINLVQRLETYLTEKGFKLYNPEVHLIGGHRECLEIVKAIEESACVLVFLTNDYNKLFEFNIAVQDGIDANQQYIIPVLVEPLAADIEEEIAMYLNANASYPLQDDQQLFKNVEDEIIFHKERCKLVNKRGKH